MRRRREKLLVSVLILSAVAAAFVVTARYASARSLAEPPWLVTPVDRAIPLVPWTVWIYVSWYVAPFSLLFNGLREVRRVSVAVLVGFVTCVTAYAVFPIAIVRPPVPPAPGASLALLRLLYAVDAPVNVLPSFHAVVSLVVVDAMRARGLGTVATLWALAVCVSCVTTGQHHILDVVAGLAVGAGAIRLSNATLPDAELHSTGSPIPSTAT
jgi:hypothetical protein